MLLAALTFSGTAWLVPAGIVLALAVVLLVWSYRAAPSGPLRVACVALKILGLAALALCLLEPLWTGQRARPGANVFAVVADNSQSLSVKDRTETRSRGEQLRELVVGAWSGPLADAFEVRRYTFDARLQNTTDFHELTFDGRASALTASLKTLAERFRGRPLAGVLLFTDGNATDLTTAPADLAGLPPIFPVVVGRRESARDLAVQQVRVSQSAFEDAPVSIQADIAAAGFAGESAVVRVTDQAGKVVQEQRLEVRQEVETLAFHFNLKPEKPGLSFYQLSVAPRADAATPARAEATLANNRRVLVVDRGQGPYRILYVAGRANWEFKFLNRAVQEDDQLALVGLIRVAKREPKFDFRGRGGETSNPLYRGFGNQAAEEVERYDQPVLIRINTRDEIELRSGFPRTAEELYPYNAVIVDDLEAGFFAADQASLLQKFVSERGGGFLMLGGMESFREGGYARTPVGDMLPVYLDRVAAAAEGAEEKPPGPLHFEIAREGWLQPWARLRDNEAAEKERVAAMTPFQIVNRVTELKPGASVIATVSEEGGGVLPALIVQRFGRGRTAALTVGDVWRWGLEDADKHADMDKSWRQLMRWLVADVPNRVDCAIEPQPGDPNGAVTINVRARDPKFLPLDDAKVTLEIQPVLSDAPAGSAGPLRLTAEPSATEQGLYTATYVPRATGGYKATAVVASQTGAEVGRAEAGWSTDLAAEEFRSLAPNVAFLETLAKQTKGEVIAAEKLEAFVRTLPNRQAPVMETWTQPAWHTPVLFAFALACLLAEWALRRWNGLP